MLQELRARAAAGDVEACLQLAKKLVRGRGEERNFEEAVEWFDRAAQAGRTPMENYMMWHISRRFR